MIADAKMTLPPADLIANFGMLGQLELWVMPDAGKVRLLIALHNTMTTFRREHLMEPAEAQRLAAALVRGAQLARIMEPESGA